MTVESRVRQARREEADLLAELVNYAGEGMPVYFWAKAAGDGETPWDVGRNRALREEGSFSYRNAAMIEVEGKAAGCLIGYSIPEDPEPVSPDMPPMVAPLQELENEAPGTWYVNVLAVLPEFRNLGLGSELLRLAEAIAGERGSRGLSIIVSDSNEGARRLYERHGYRETARRPKVKEDWVNDGNEWVLLTKAA